MARRERFSCQSKARTPLSSLSCNMLKESTVAHWFAICTEVSCSTNILIDTAPNIFRSKFLNGCNNLNSACTDDFPVSSLGIHFLWIQKINLLNGFFPSFVIDSKLEGEDYWAVPSAFPFIKKFFQRSLWRSERPDLTVILMVHPSILSLFFSNLEIEVNIQPVGSVHKNSFFLDQKEKLHLKISGKYPFSPTILQTRSCLRLIHKIRLLDASWCVIFWAFWL